MFILKPENNLTIFGLYISWIGFAFAMFFFFSPIILIINLFKRQINAKEVPFILMIATLLNCVLWLVKGALSYDSVILIGNIIGACLNLVYLSIFWFFLFANLKFRLLALLATLICISSVFSLFYFLIKDENIASITACVFNVIMYAAPGQLIIDVIKKKDYKLIPIISSIIGLLCSSCWMLYGWFGKTLKDITIIIPNTLGTIKQN